MDLHLNKKVILVTGGGGMEGSIGETIVQSIVKEHAIPVIIDKHYRGKELEEKIKQKGNEALFIQADLRNEDECKKAVNETIINFGRIDALVNNLGINDSVGLENSVDDFLASLQLNLVSFFSMTKYCLDALKKSKGVILNIASKVAVTGQGGTSGYAASKGGILALTREWAVDLREYSIRVNALVVSESWTPGYNEWLGKFENPAEKREYICKKIPYEQRMTRPEEIADTALFLISDRSSHTTGQHVFVDGGYVHLDRAI